MHLSLPPSPIFFLGGWGGGKSVNKVHYGLGENGQFSKTTTDMVALAFEFAGEVLSQFE